MPKDCKHAALVPILICVDVSWMDIILLITVKLFECKLGPFEYTQSMPKWPPRLVYIGNIIDYPLNLPSPFPKGLEADLEGSSIFLPLMLLIHINSLGLVS